MDFSACLFLPLSVPVRGEWLNDAYADVHADADAIAIADADTDSGGGDDDAD